VCGAPGPCRGLVGCKGAGAGGGTAAAVGVSFVCICGGALGEPSCVHARRVCVHCVRRRAKAVGGGPGGPGGW